MSNFLNQISVDIIMPNYNGSEYIEETLNSVISQSFSNWKLFIVDGNSDDSTKKILNKYNTHPKINVVGLKKNKKAGFSRNLALRYCQSDYIAFLDSDDIWEKEKLSKQLVFMRENNYDFTYTNYITFGSIKKQHNLREIRPPDKISFEEFVKNTSIGTSTMIIKKKLIGTSKFSSTKICEDYFFKCQILKKINFAHCFPKNLTKYRIRKNSLQSNKIRNLYWIWYINKNFNKINFFQNVISLIFISINSIKKYGFK